MIICGNWCLELECSVFCSVILLRWSHLIKFNHDRCEAFRFKVVKLIIAHTWSGKARLGALSLWTSGHMHECIYVQLSAQSCCCQGLFVRRGDYDERGSVYTGDNKAILIILMESAATRMRGTFEERKINEWMNEWNKEMNNEIKWEVRVMRITSIAFCVIQLLIHALTSTAI